MPTGEKTPRVICPACRKGIKITLDEVNFYGQLICPKCDALLEVVEEDPLKVEEVHVE